jgi:hypothetical protein
MARIVATRKGDAMGNRISGRQLAAAARLAPLDFVAVAGIIYFFFMALRWRATIQLHARYMLATALFLLNPVIGRLLTDIPPLKIDGPEQLHLFAIAVRVGNLLVLALLFLLYRGSGRHSRPFKVAALFVAMQMLLFETLGPWPAWQRVYAHLADVPALAMAGPALALGLALGLVVTILGWQMGTRRPRVAAVV